MNETDVLTGRIAQKIYDGRLRGATEQFIRYRVKHSHDIKRLVDNLFELFPGCKIAFENCESWYRITIHVVHWRNEVNHRYTVVDEDGFPIT